MAMFNKRNRRQGFTIVELAVVIIVIGILASMVVLGFGSWRTTVATSEVKSDLTNVKAAMESARNFGSGYPTAIPATFTASQNVTVTYVSGSATEYCIEGKSNAVETVNYFMDSVRTGGEPREGTCAAGEDLPPLADEPETGPNKIAAGYVHGCGLWNGKAYCWGSNNYGHLGNGTLTNSPNALVAVGGDLADKTVDDIAAGAYHSCAISENVPYCWGHNHYGQLGGPSFAAVFWGMPFDSPDNNNPLPVQVNTATGLAGKTLSSLTTGGQHTCVIGNGTAYCWGQGNQGALGYGLYGHQDSPKEVLGTLGGKAVNQIEAGEWNTCAISEGKVHCWGNGTSGAIGNNNTGTQTAPVLVTNTGVLSGKTMTQVSVGTGYACALSSDGKAYCWGKNTHGNLGNGTTTQSLVPVEVDMTGALAGKTFKSISAGKQHTCGVASDNRAYCWGSNVLGTLGDGTPADTAAHTTPVAVTTGGVLSGKTISDVVAGQSITYARSAAIKYGWGNIYADGSSTLTVPSIPGLISVP